MKDIKSIYILKKIFDHLYLRKTLEIIKYNKIAKDKLEFTINNYIDFPKIEFEITPVFNQSGQFFNQVEKGKEKYCHIYFDDNEEEIKRGYLKEEDVVAKIKIILDYKIDSFKELFKYCKIIESIKCTKFYRNNIIDMTEMFCGCSLLKSVDLSNFITTNVAYMNNMFYGCSSLTEINLSNFNTINLSDMGGMFKGCSSLQKINLSSFNTDNVTDMSGIFFDCKRLKEINLSNFNTNNVTDMNCLFYGCSSLKEINLENFINVLI